MKTNIYRIIILLLSSTFAYSQQSTDFTVDDCNGVSHSLYSELDAGKVIVLCWVMPCGPCATGAGYAQDAVGLFDSSHPGIVQFYMSDDFANSDCNYLNGWASSYQLYPDAMFSNSLISMNDYGTPGMPKVVVIGPNKQVFYNVNNNQITQSGVEDGINQALLGTVSLSEDDILDVSFNFCSIEKQVKLVYESFSPSIIQIYNMLGELVVTDYIDEPNNKFIDVKDLNMGLYILNVNSSKQNHTFRFVR